ncbi:hypothetical protein P692DRAFT_201811177 [Suillus brevipes Sb2]|nr:hypothetical protein P692DRAFT_201811177 [Suillus brevipes Sb2]
MSDAYQRISRVWLRTNCGQERSPLEDGLRESASTDTPQHKATGRLASGLYSGAGGEAGTGAGEVKTLSAQTFAPASTCSSSGDDARGTERGVGAGRVDGTGGVGGARESCDGGTGGVEACERDAADAAVRTGAFEGASAAFFAGGGVAAGGQKWRQLRDIYVNLWDIMNLSANTALLDGNGAIPYSVQSPCARGT